MKLTVHPPLFVAPFGDAAAQRAAEAWHHASLWLTVDLPNWRVVRTGHLHLLWKPDGSDVRCVDLAGHPLQPWQEPDPYPEDDLAAQLDGFLAGWELRFFRLGPSELVSELGEGRDDFRRRATGLLRPEIQSRIADPPERDSREKSRIASELGQVVASMEEIVVDDPSACVRRAQVGRLWVAPGVHLGPRRPRDPML